jgi:Transcriptional Coactivator p15 (PC4)
MAEKKTRKRLAQKSAQAKDIVVAEWRATKREVLRVMLRDFKGHKLVDIRRWYRDAEGKLCPGKGISCRPWDIEPLRKALRKADRRLSGRR